jgi:uncharacterized protein (TIGR03435 family)
MKDYAEKPRSCWPKLNPAQAGIVALAVPLIVGLIIAPQLRAQAPNITATWQGTLQAGNPLRIVIKISKEDESLKAVFYSIDQQGQPRAAAITLHGSAVEISVPANGGIYKGTLSADGNSIVGIWTQETNSLTLNLTRATSETAWAIPEPPSVLKPMAADANPVFEVAVIKPSNPDEQVKEFRVNGRQFSTRNMTVKDIITYAYGLHPRQIIGGPAWLESEKYDLLAQPDGEGQPNEQQWKTMIQKLLADRFKLTFHRDKEELSVYAITIGKAGPKLTKSAGDPNGLPTIAFKGLGVLPVVNATITDFASVMQIAVLDRPVVDQTGITGRYDFTLTWTPDETQFAALGVRLPPPVADNPAAPPNLFEAMQGQLGLKLEATKAAADVLVIDHVEEPSPN